MIPVYITSISNHLCSLLSFLYRSLSLGGYHCTLLSRTGRLRPIDSVHITLRNFSQRDGVLLFILDTCRVYRHSLFFYLYFFLLRPCTFGILLISLYEPTKIWDSGRQEERRKMTSRWAPIWVNMKGIRLRDKGRARKKKRMGLFI